MKEIKKGSKEEALERKKGRKGSKYEKADNEFKAGYKSRKGHEDKEEEEVEKSAPKGR